MRKLIPLPESRFDWFGEDLANMIATQRREAAERSKEEQPENPGETEDRD